jgi:hypothetical protein
MVREVFTGVVAMALVGVGWVAAKAQTPAPAFELIVDAPVGTDDDQMRPRLYADVGRTRHQPE